MDIEEKVIISQLLDYYGGLLPGAQYDILKLRFDSDLTLQEIAECQGISRQGVRDSIIRGVKLLYEYDSKLKLKDRMDTIRVKLIKLSDCVKDNDVKSELDIIIKGLEEN